MATGYDKDLINEVSYCKEKMAGLCSDQSGIKDTISRMNGEIDSLFRKIEGNGHPGIKDDISEIKNKVDLMKVEIENVYDDNEDNKKNINSLKGNMEDLKISVSELCKAQEKSEKTKTAVKGWIGGLIASIIVMLLSTIISTVSIHNRTNMQYQQYEEINTTLQQLKKVNLKKSQP